MSTPYRSLPPQSITEVGVLVETLRLAVPFWIVELRRFTPEQRMARANRCATVVGSKGDALQFKGKTASGRRNTIDAFNSLAEGLACAAYLPGGITFAGLHWCVGSGHMGKPMEKSGPCKEEVERERPENESIGKADSPVPGIVTLATRDGVL